MVDGQPDAPREIGGKHCQPREGERPPLDSSGDEKRCKERSQREALALVLRQCARREEQRGGRKHPGGVGAQPRCHRGNAEGNEERQGDVGVVRLQLVEKARHADDGQQRRCEQEPPGCCPQQAPGPADEADPEAEELQMDGSPVERSHEPEVDGFEPRQQERMLELDVDRARESGANGMPEVVERPGPKPPDRPPVPLEQRLDREEPGGGHGEHERGREHGEWGKVANAGSRRLPHASSRSLQPGSE